MLETTDFLTSLQTVVGENHVLTADDQIAGFLIDVRRRYEGDALCIVEPGSTEEVSDVVRLCSQHRVPITPIGGNTGLVGGAAVIGRSSESGEIVKGIGLSMRRMNKIREISPLAETITVEAGCVLQSIQDAAKAEDMQFPLSLSAEGSCQIGGNIATNAGGTAALRFGVTRNLVLGLEVVLPSGEVISRLSGLRKNNTGYDLKQLFIGSEGTLGIITAAVLRIFPRPLSRETALVAVNSVDDGLRILRRMKATFGERITAAEITEADYMSLVLEQMQGTRLPFEALPTWSLLLEVSDTREDTDLAPLLQETLVKALEDDMAQDVVIAQNDRQAEEFWYLRHAVSDAIRRAGPNMSHDSSVPLMSQGDYVEMTRERILGVFPEARPLYVGHLGDGNMHLVVLFAQGRFADPDDYNKVSGELDQIIDGVVSELQGGVTAEHGIGLSYRARLARAIGPEEVALMRGIKRVFDPDNIMNPGKLFLED